MSFYKQFTMTRSPHRSARDSNKRYFVTHDFIFISFSVSVCGMKLLPYVKKGSGLSSHHGKTCTSRVLLHSLNVLWSVNWWRDSEARPSCTSLWACIDKGSTGVFGRSLWEAASQTLLISELSGRSSRLLLRSQVCWQSGHESDVHDVLIMKATDRPVYTERDWTEQ